MIWERLPIGPPR